MATLNRWQGIGNLTRDPERRFTQSNKSVTKFTVAVNNPHNKNEVLFIDVIAWEKLGDRCHDRLKQGHSVFVDGRLVIRSYDSTKHPGEKAKATEVVADDVQFIEKTAKADATDEGSADAGVAPEDHTGIFAD